MKLTTLAVLIAVTQFSSSAFACAKHPGMTHEQWTSTVKSEKDKNGNEVSMSKGFFDAKPKGNADAPPPTYEETIGRRRVPSSGGERKIREIQ